MVDRRTILIAGASRGLGLALAEEYCGRDWQVIATERSKSAALAALATRFPGSLEVEQLDIVNANSIHGLRARHDGKRIDILFVNAGICKARENTPIDVAEADFVDLMLTNALSPMRVVEAFENLVSTPGVIAVMSSELGSIAGNQGFWEIYSASKAALNMLMKCFAARHANDPRAMLLVAPGWVRTDMGGADAPLSIEESIPRVADAVEKSIGRAGLRFIDNRGHALPW